MSVTAAGSWRGVGVRTRYSEQHIRVLLPQAVWGIDPLRPAPIPDYRKGTDQRPSDMPAMFADMQRAWGQAWMTKSMRRALFVHLAMDLPQHQGAALLGVPQQTLSDHYQLGIKALLDYLNGDEGE